MRKNLKNKVVLENRMGEASFRRMGSHKSGEKRLSEVLS